jgi:hypothetical protein
VVVFGDTQNIADYQYAQNGVFPRAAWLEAMVDWVIENRERENIDFVLQVGDITEHGWWLPMWPGCLGNCSLPSCHCPAEVALEWSAFFAQFRRLETAGIPFAIVPGNHDNIADGGGPLDGPGFSDYYGPDRLASLPGYLESKGSAATGCIASAWQFSLGPEPIIVLGLPDSDFNPPSQTPPDGNSATERCPSEDPEIDAWAIELIERPEHRSKQVIALHHRLLNADLSRRPKWLNTISRRPERFMAAVSGHFEPAIFPFIAETHSQTGAPLQVFAPRVDWQGLELPGQGVPTAASSLAVMRFHLKGGQPDQVEVRAWSEYFQVAGGVTDEPGENDELPLRDYSIWHDRDLDGDGIRDDLDPCPRHASALRLDRDADGRGDVCECGDQDGDGMSTVMDLVAIQRAIFDPSKVGPLCDADNDGKCSVSDMLAANLEIFSPGNTSTCARQPVPGP